MCKNKVKDVQMCEITELAVAIYGNYIYLCFFFKKRAAIVVVI